MAELCVEITQLPLGRFFRFVGFEITDETSTKLSVELFSAGHFGNIKVHVEQDMLAVATREPDYDVFVREALEKVLMARICLTLCP